MLTKFIEYMKFIFKAPLIAAFKTTGYGNRPQDFDLKMLLCFGFVWFGYLMPNFVFHMNLI